MTIQPCRCSKVLLECELRSELALSGPLIYVWNLELYQGMETAVVPGSPKSG